MFERPKPFRRQTRPEPDSSRPPETGAEGLTRAQAHALSRCAPLTPAEFKRRRQAAEQGILSLSSLLGDSEARKR